MRKRLTLVLMALFMVALLSSAEGFRWIGGRWWGISLSYSLKWYSYSDGRGRTRSANYFGEDGRMQGIRFGIPVEPVFWRGLGISTGIFGEVFSCKNEAVTRRIELVGLYFPFHVMYRHNFTPRFSLGVSTGPALTVGLLQTMIDPTDSTRKGYHVKFGQGSPNRVDCLWEASVSAIYRMFRFSFVYSYGQTPHNSFLSVNGEDNNFDTAHTMVLSINAGIAF